ncbi:MAG: penicillin-binding transpeptidase domain-containing protein [Verrucomicrobiales bacterium]
MSDRVRVIAPAEVLTEVPVVAPAEVILPAAPSTESATAPAPPREVPTAPGLDSVMTVVEEAMAESSEALEQVPAEEEISLGATWETRTEARTLTLVVPAPRGQISDREGRPLAVNRVAYYLALNFPYLDSPKEEEILAYAYKRVAIANRALEGKWALEPDAILKHYRHRRWLPLPFTAVLSPGQIETVTPLLDKGLILHPVYQRFYPGGDLAAHVLGYVGKTRPMPTGPIQGGEPLFLEMEGRDGLERSFERYLRGEPGRINVLFDTDGSKLTDEMIRRPEPGKNVVTTIDAKMQGIAESILRRKVQRGAFVMMDIYSGDILVMASWPSYAPGDFVPFISKEKFEALQNDPDIPLYARAFRGLYPPASTFKIPVALAAIQSETIGADSYFDCPTSFWVGDRLFHNWAKEHEGSLNVVQALKRSCNTWFYQVGIKTGAQPITTMAQLLGLGKKTGIPLQGEPDGFVPTDEFMLEKYGHRILPGDIANIAIGQGFLLTSPLQMAQMMAGVAHGLSAPRARLVRQVQNLNNEVLEAFPEERLAPLNLSANAHNLVVQGMIDVVNAGNGTGHAGGHPFLEVAGKTGTAQWGNLEEKRNVGWFAGFVPARQPLYAFAALYEGNPGEKVGGGAKAAPIVGEFLEEVFRKEEAEEILTEAQEMARDTGNQIAKAEVIENPAGLQVNVRAVEAQPDEKPGNGSIRRWWGRLFR